MSILTPPSSQALQRAAALLMAGELVAFPTETVYGLGADAACDAAVQRLYAAKGRPAHNPLIVHVDGRAMAETVAEISDLALEVLTLFWPGPLTLVLPGKPGAPVSSLALGGHTTVAVRQPAHPVAQQLIGAFGKPLVAPSANRSGHISPTQPRHVMEDLGDHVAMILAAGATPVGLESTIVDMTATPPRLLRPGGVTPDQLRAALPDLQFENVTNNITPTAPGQLTRHYAPTLPVVLNCHRPAPSDVYITFGPTPLKPSCLAMLSLSDASDMDQAATRLYAVLREAETVPDATRIAVAPIPEQGLGVAINERLRRAAAQ